MKTTYSLYEAKAKLSEIIRLVRRNLRVTITYHDKPVAQITSIDKFPQTLEDQIAKFANDGAIILAKPKPFFKVMTAKGALKRFLDSRE